MLDWYHLFVVAVGLLWAGATSADRNALRIVMAATITSWLLVDFGTSHFDGAWKLTVPGSVETVTILCLLMWAGRTGRYQAGCLVVAWIAHVLCFFDVTRNTDLVYTHYESILSGVSIAQLALFHDTYLHHIRRLGHWWSQSGGDRAVVVHTPSLSSPVLHHPSNLGTQTTTPCTTT